MPAATYMYISFNLLWHNIHWSFTMSMPQANIPEHCGMICGKRCTASCHSVVPITEQSESQNVQVEIMIGLIV
jgi:hypothetical protein